MKTTSIILAVLGLVGGLASSWFWWRSSRASFTVTWANFVTPSGPVITGNVLEAYLKEVGALNAKAAVFGAIGVLLSTLAGVAASF
jgi:hypothetical protein